MRYRMVLFDFDGTLADSLPWFIQIVNQVAGRFRFKKIEESEIPKVRAMSSRMAMAYLGISFWKLPFIARHMRALMSKDIGSISAFPGVGEMLASIRQRGIVIGVVSSNSEKNIRQVLGETNCQLVSHYECSVSFFGKRKRLRKLVKSTGLPPEQILFVGDEVRDIEAARHEGVASAAVSWGFGDLAHLKSQQPTEVFEALDEIALRLLSG